MTLLPEAVASWVEASCAAQGMPVAVVDTEAIIRIGVLLRGTRAAGRVRSTDRSAGPSAGPGGADPVGIESAIASRGDRVHGGEIKHGGDDLLVLSARDILAVIEK